MSPGGSVLVSPDTTRGTKTCGGLMLVPAEPHSAVLPVTRHEPVFLIEVPSRGRDNVSIQPKTVKGNGEEWEAPVSSGPREKPEEQQKATPDSGTTKPDDSNSPDDEVRRLPTPESLTPTPAG